jgi:hypothetical protein
MKTKTIIHSNGSKFLGQKPDTIPQLIDVLNKHRLNKFQSIRKDQENDRMHFSGNFVDRSHVFHIETNDPEIIKELTWAMKQNPGYTEKELVKNS